MFLYEKVKTFNSKIDNDEKIITYYRDYVFVYILFSNKKAG